MKTSLPRPDDDQQRRHDDAEHLRYCRFVAEACRALDNLRRKRQRPDVIDNDGEAEALTDEWTVPNNAVDVFAVKLYVGSTAGLSPVPGPCDKDAKGMDGTVVELIGGTTGLVLAHEVGHYLVSTT